jgi:hypothetical protein
LRIPQSLAELTALFERLGARDPAAWAASQLEEGIPQLHRFLFLRQAWTAIEAQSDAQWIAAYVALAEKQPDAPYAGLGLALKRALAAGAASVDVAEIARAAQAQLLFQLCYLMEDPSLDETELEGLGWGLFRTDEEGQPLGPIWGLHESVLETDPTGREMRPEGP